MNATAKVISTGPVAVTPIPVSGVGEIPRNRLILYVIIGSFLLTAVATYSLMLTQRLESTYFEIDKTKIENNNLVREIDALESEVNSLKSLDRVESVLRDAGIQLAVPSTVLYLDVAKANGQIARQTIRVTGKEKI